MVKRLGWALEQGVLPRQCSRPSAATLPVGTHRSIRAGHLAAGRRNVAGDREPAWLTGKGGRGRRARMGRYVAMSWTALAPC